MKNKLLNQEEQDVLTARMRSEFSPEYFKKLFEEWPKERVAKYFGNKQEPGAASGLWRDNPEGYYRAKMVACYRDKFPNQLPANLRLTGEQQKKLFVTSKLY